MPEPYFNFEGAILDARQIAGIYLHRFGFSAYVGVTCLPCVPAGFAFQLNWLVWLGLGGCLLSIAMTIAEDAGVYDVWQVHVCFSSGEKARFGAFSRKRAEELVAQLQERLNQFATSGR